jgi:hypothetical protein
MQAYIIRNADMPSNATITKVLDAFAFSQKAPTSFVMYVRPSVRTHQWSSHWADFREI